MSKIVNVLMTENFKNLETKQIDNDDLANYIKTHDSVFLDERTGVFTCDTNLSNLDWYYNYLNLCSDFARRNPGSYSTYILDLGYIPIVYLPSFAQPLAPKLLSKLQVSGIPFIQHKATSFILSYYNSDVMDAWVSKMDIEKHMGISIEKATSVEVARRVFES